MLHCSDGVLVIVVVPLLKKNDSFCIMNVLKHCCLMRFWILTVSYRKKRWQKGKLKKSLLPLSHYQQS